MKKILSTTEIIKGAEYINDLLIYFQSFNKYWGEVKGQVLKLETRQIYREPGNTSYDEFEKGNYSKSIKILPIVRKEDEELYKQLADNNIDFIRCRSVILPLSKYLKWEINCYSINTRYGESIYFTNELDYFNNFAHHDFIVFDRLLAVIHNYNKDGELIGGWIVKDLDQIDNLIMIFSIIKADSIEYKKFINKYDVDISL